MADEFVPASSTTSGQDCEEKAGGWGVKSTAYEYIWKGEIDQSKYPTEACPPRYHGNALIDNLRVKETIQVGIGGIVITTTTSGLVGIGTTNPTSALTVKGNTSLETLNVSGVSTFAGITTVTGTTLFSKQLSVSGITTSLIYATTGTTSFTDGSTSQPQIDARVTEMHYHSASFSGNRSFQISYLTNGRSVRFYIRNTNASSRDIGFQASTTDSFGGASTVELSGGGGYSSTTFSISGISGGSTATAMVLVTNINGNFVGSIQ